MIHLQAKTTCVPTTSESDCTLTPNSLQFVGTTVLPELEPHHEENRDLRKRARYLKTCKDHMWKRWSTEYLCALREKRNMKPHGKPSTLSVGEVIIITSDERNRGKWYWE
jgi:hypothetical protein